MLKLKNVSKYYAKDGVITSGFTKVNLELFMGEFVVITGESGSGKSTLLNVLSGLDSYEDGELYINGEETSHYSENDYLEYRRKYVSNIFQNFNLVNSYTVYQNIELALLMSGHKKSSSKKIVLDLIEKCGLTKYKNTLASKLSGGQKQRVAIARALASDAPIIICDEPTGALDSKSSKEIIKLLYEMRENKLIIVVTHNKEEIEKYATRLIKMHDGTILEDKIVKKINLDNDLVNREVKGITNINKIKLGIRNAFNLPVKFVLMFTIFLVIGLALLTNYGIFCASKYESDNTSYNDYFMDTSDNRIIVKKRDGTIFNDIDYEKIKEIQNIDKIVENDLILDLDMAIYSNNLYLYGKVNTSEVTFVDIGRTIKNDNEVIIKTSKDNWYIENYQKELFNENFLLELYNNNENQSVKVVGIIYDDTSSYYSDFEFYFSDNLKEEINLSSFEKMFKVSYKINDTYINDYIYNNLKVNEKLNEGEVLIDSRLNEVCKNSNCKNDIFKVNVKNIYIDEEFSFTSINTYTRDNSKKLLGYSYDDIEGSVFISKEDYNKIFNQGNYQSSVFVSELRYLDSVNEKLQNLGFETFKMKDTKYNEGREILKILNIFELIVTFVLIITLFFIAYFVIKIIYKSRNSYYTTLRTLGGTKKVCINILLSELITLATSTYLFSLAFIYLINKNVIDIEYFREITKYIGVTEYIIIYLILVLLSVLIANRYGRKIFKSSIIKTYGERI